MNYDPMAALDLEKRTGVKNSDIDDFLRKADAVQDAIRGLKDGTLDPTKEIKIEGIETEEEKKSKAEELARKKEEYLAREVKKKAKLKQEEKDKWWRGAELFQGMDPTQMADEDDEDNVCSSTTDSETVKQQAVLQRYSNDYSRWEMPVVDDPATLAEEAEKAAQKEAQENALFEKNNPDFCGEFRADQQKRAAAAEEKKSGANVLRLKGNRFFKAKRYSEAIEKYMASLKVQPYAVNTLTNISIAHHKKSAFDDALEFANRSVYLEPTNIKARCRRAATLRALGKLEEALIDAQYALNATLAKKNNANGRGLEGRAEVEASKAADSEFIEVTKLVEELEGEISDREIEQTVAEEAKKATVKDDAIEKKLKAQLKGQGDGGEFKKVAIEMDEDTDSDTQEIKEDNIENQSANKVADTPPSMQKMKSNNKVTTTFTSKGSMTTQPPPASIESLMNSLNGSDPLSDLELPSQYRIIDELMATLQDSASGGLTKSGVPALNVLALLLKDSKEARVYLRTSDGLMFLCCRLCGGGLAVPTPVSNVIGVRPDGEGFDLDDADDDGDEIGRPHAALDLDPARTLAAIATAVVGERRSKVIVRDQGVLQAAIALLSKTPTLTTGGGASEESLPAKLMIDTLADDCDSTLVSQLLEKGHMQDAIAVAALALISACIDGVGGESYAHFLSSDVPALTAILSTLPPQSQASSTTSNNMSPLLHKGKTRQFMLTASLFRDLCLIETCRESIFKHSVHPQINSSTTALTESFRFFPETEAEIAKKKKQEQKKKRQTEMVKSPDPVTALAQALERTSSKVVLGLGDKRQTELLEARESCVAALANLALHVAMRSRFEPALLPLLEVATQVKKTGSSNAKQVKKNKKTPSGGADHMCETPAAAAFALAALMNALISEDAMKMVLCENQGVFKLLQLLKHIAGSGYGVIRVRVAGLLGRLVSVASSVEELRKDASVSILANAINNNSSEYATNKEKWVLDEREHLVRVIAATLAAGKGAQPIINTLHSSNTLGVLVDFLPRAACDASGRVTATSVVMPSPDRISFKLSGNVVKCFVSVMDEATAPPAQRLIKAGLLEKLVGLLANTQELSVRKNVAVVLARAMKHPPAMERVRELRGMEMLVQLGPQL